MNMQRIQLLLAQHRFDMAEKELRELLAAEPENAQAHYLLSFTMARLERWKEAEEEAQKTIALVPDLHWGHFALAQAYFLQDKNQQAEQAIKEVIRINPTDADAWSILAGIYGDYGKWQESLRFAEQGLSFDPEDERLTSQRAMALNKLGRPMDSESTLRSALHRSPDNSHTHATQGWVLLEQGDSNKAMDHFREALRLDPTSEWARRGIVEAMKARNPIYRLLLSYFFGMSRLDARTRNYVIIGALIGYQVLLRVVDSVPALSPYSTLITIVYLLLVFASWTGDILFNLILRLDSFGRLALNEDEIRTSNYVGLLLLAALVCVIFYLRAGLGVFADSAIVFAGLILPLSTVMRPRRRTRPFQKNFAIALGVVGIASILFRFIGAPIGGNLVVLFIYGLVAFTWVVAFSR